MGKGGTKFEGEAIGVRSSKKGAEYSGKDRRKAMEKFLETGKHPLVEMAERDKALNASMVPLPEFDPHRPFIFLDLTVGNKPTTRLVIELFDDIAPGAANHLRNRCLPGSSSGLKNATAHTLMRHQAVFLGKNPKASEGVLLPHVPKLRHMESGAVSVSFSGDEVAISLSQALNLDHTHQVVGRVHLGKDTLELINDLPVTSGDAPLNPIKVVRCGPTNSRGTNESLEESASNKGDGKDVATRVKEASMQARGAVLAALQEGLGTKRKLEGDADKPGTSTDKVSGKEAAPVTRSVKPKFFDAMLGDLSDSGSGSSEDDGGEAG